MPYNPLNESLREYSYPALFIVREDLACDNFGLCAEAGNTWKGCVTNAPKVETSGQNGALGEVPLGFAAGMLRKHRREQGDATI